MSDTTLANKVDAIVTSLEANGWPNQDGNDGAFGVFVAEVLCQAAARIRDRGEPTQAPEMMTAKQITTMEVEVSRVVGKLFSMGAATGFVFGCVFGCVATFIVMGLTR